MDATLKQAEQAPLRTTDVSRATGYSVQQVRDLERLGVIPPAARAANGYRGYSALHLRALDAYRHLAVAVGPVEARRMLADLWGSNLDEAAAAIGAAHVRLATERDQLVQARQALRAIRADAAASPSLERSRGDDAMTITELAEALGVRTSTLRFWEQEGLVAPERVTSLRVRRYGTNEIQSLRIVAALRAAGYRIPAIRGILASLHDLEGRDSTATILQQRLDDLARRSVSLLEAGADLAALIRSRDAG